MRVFILIAAAMTLLGATSVTPSSPPPAEVQAGNFFLGNWSCVHTFGADGGTYTTRYQRVLGDAWIRQTYDFAATRTVPSLQGEWFFGYDPERQKWIRLGAMSDGLYFAMVGARSDNVWSYSYELPGKSSVETVYTERSATEYTVDGPTYPINGKVITEHHRCHRISD